MPGNNIRQKSDFSKQTFGSPKTGIIFKAFDARGIFLESQQNK